MTKDIEKMTIKEFHKIPYRESWDSEVEEFDSLVILPLEELHDSGFRLMDFVACKNKESICRLSGCSDVLHIDGIGGFGFNWINMPNKGMLEAKGWGVLTVFQRVDCYGYLLTEVLI